MQKSHNSDLFEMESTDDGGGKAGASYMSTICPSRYLVERGAYGNMYDGCYIDESFVPPRRGNFPVRSCSFSSFEDDKEMSRRAATVALVFKPSVKKPPYNICTEMISSGFPFVGDAGARQQDVFPIVKLDVFLSLSYAHWYPSMAYAPLNANGWMPVHTDIANKKLGVLQEEKEAAAVKKAAKAVKVKGKKKTRSGHGQGEPRIGAAAFAQLKQKQSANAKAAKVTKVVRIGAAGETREGAAGEVSEGIAELVEVGSSAGVRLDGFVPSCSFGGNGVQDRSNIFYHYQQKASVEVSQIAAGLAGSSLSGDAVS